VGVAPQELQGIAPHRHLVHTISLANYLCNRAGWTSLGVHNVEPPSDDTYTMLGLDPSLCDLVWESIEPSLDEV
jgi:hypothetical protein